MNLPFELAIGLRYLRARRRNGFISFISLISMLGIGLGVAALIIVLSVMNGFQHEIRSRMLAVASHVEVTGQGGQLYDWPVVARDLAPLVPELQGSAPFVNGQGLVSAQGTVRGAMVRGVLPEQENSVVEVGRKMVAGRLENLRPGEFGVVIGAELAKQLGATLGSKLTVITPQGNVTPAGMMPRLKSFTVVGVFKIDMYEYDSSLAMIHLKDAQVLFRTGAAVSGLRLKLADPLEAPYVKQRLNQNMQGLWASDWTDVNANYFRAVQIEKRMMFIILTLIVAVAAFNLVSTLVMVVTDKRADIAILRTLGASPASIMKIFMVQGGVAGVIGTLSGMGFGVLVALNLDVIVPAIERLIGSKILSSSVYLIDYLPSDVQVSDVTTITVIALLLSFVATLYPSWRAARTQPAEALRYE